MEDFACHSAACRPPTAGGTGGSSSAAYMEMKRRDALQQRTIQVNKYRAGIGMDTLPVTESDRKQAAAAKLAEAEAKVRGRQMKPIQNIGKFKARLLPDSVLATLLPHVSGKARTSIKSEMQRRGLRYSEVVERKKLTA